MKHLFKLSLLLLALLLPATASAYDFEVDGIYYNIDGNNATVTYKGTSYDQYSNEYTGDVTIPETVTNNGATYSVTNIGALAFRDCSGLTSINIPNSVTSIGLSAFYGCIGLIGVTIPNSVTSIDDYAFYECSGLTSMTIGNSVTSIGRLAFYRCYGLTSLTIGNSVKSIGGSAFCECSGLTSVTIPNSVTLIGNGAFDACSGLTSIVVESGNPNYDSRNNCNAIIETATNTIIIGCMNTTIPNSVTSIGFYAFGKCNGLTSVSIPNSVTLIGKRAFDSCSGLTSVTIGNSVTFIGEYAFENCSCLTSVTIGNSVTSIGGAAFRDCSSLTSLTIPNSVTNIGGSAFSGCSRLTSVTIGNSVMSIGNQAFYKCYNISTLIVSGEGEWQAGAIGIYSFLALYVDSRITSLKGIHVNPSWGVYCYAATPPSCDGNTFTDYSGTLHVPATSLAAYFTADYWCNFTNIVGDAEEPTMVAISKDSIEMQLGNEHMLTASVVPPNATPNTITWSSTNTAIASVYNGRVSAVGVGECDIIAQCLNLRAICHVVVNDTTVTISLDRHEAQVLPNHIITLTLSASPVMPELVVSSSDPTVASARLANGKVQVVGIKEGATNITVASVDGKAVPDTCLVTVYTEPGDVNCDGFVNISDVTALIDCLLSGDFDSVSQTNADCDQNGQVNISDVTTLIDYLLSGHW